jgi:hypothetical protein
MGGTGSHHVKQNKPGRKTNIACSVSYVESIPKKKKRMT